MALVRIKEKFQLTVPIEIRRRSKCAVGDLFEASISQDGSVLTFKSKVLVDRSADPTIGKKSRRER